MNAKCGFSFALRIANCCKARVGSSLRFYVNDTLMAEAQDATLPTGRYGLITFNAAADFDNFRAIRP